MTYENDTFLQDYKSGGKIHIKPENRGKFTAKAEGAGQGVQQYARHVLANKENYPSSTVKQARFAKAAASWQHRDGGLIERFGVDAVKRALSARKAVHKFDGKTEKTQQMETRSSSPWVFGNVDNNYALPVLQQVPYITKEKDSTYTLVNKPPLRPINTYYELNLLDVPESEITAGDVHLYGKEGNSAKYYSTPEGLLFRRDANSARFGNTMPEYFMEVPYSDIKSKLPKRDFIGGENYRINLANRIPGFMYQIQQRAKEYGVDPNVVLHRFLKEGFADQIIKQYNTADAIDQPTFFSNGHIWNDSYDTYDSLGLDYAGSNLLEGKYSLKDTTATWKDRGEARDWEGGQERIMPHVAVPDNLWSAIEMMAAETSYIQNYLRKAYGITDPSELGRYVNAGFNSGMYNPKLKDPEWVKKEYSYPDYYSKWKDDGKRPPKRINGATQ